MRHSAAVATTNGERRGRNNDGSVIYITQTLCHSTATRWLAGGRVEGHGRGQASVDADRYGLRSGPSARHRHRLRLQHGGEEGDAALLVDALFVDAGQLDDLRAGGLVD